MTTILEAPQANHARQNNGSGSLGSLIVAGVGALLFVLGLLVHFYVAPTLAVAPMDQESETFLQAKGATVFDAGTLAPITTDLSIASRTVGDVKASEKAPGDTIVWVNNTTITSADGEVRSQSSKRAAFDAKTAVASTWGENWNETTLDNRAAVQRNGLMFKFPFGTEKKTYQVWDDTLGAAVTTTFAGTTKVEGLEVYLFENTVPATVVGSRMLPPNVFGGTPGDPDVSADVNYQNSTTYFVEPTTGAIVNQVSDMRNWFTYEGTDVVATEAHLEYTPQQVKDMVHKTLGNQPMLLSLTNGFLPWVVVVLGLGMIAAGTAMSRRQQH